MSPLVYSLFFHLVGLGLISTSLVGGWLLNGQYRKASEWKQKAVILKSLRPIGLLSPISVAVLLLSGVGNMAVDNIDLFRETWLIAKLILFLIAVVCGIYFGKKSSERTKLVDQMAEGKSSEGTEAAIRVMDRQQQFFYLFNSGLIVVILVLSIVKPG